MTDKNERRKRRQVGDAEQTLWKSAVSDVKPLQGNTKEELAERPATNGKCAELAPVESSGRLQQPSRVGSRPPVTMMSPPLTGLDRRTSQRLARGQVEYEARLDLHGLTVEQARVALMRFLAESAAKGRRLVLVITGKGAAPIARHTLHGADYFDTPERQGRLRRQLPLWLAEPDMRVFITGYQPAHPRHGGGGAFYIRIRRRERLEKFR
jgi:DNA-nicking Smr family endonuclease